MSPIWINEKGRGEDSKAGGGGWGWGWGLGVSFTLQGLALEHKHPLQSHQTSPHKAAEES